MDGNRKRLLEEWEKIHKKQDSAVKNIDQVKNPEKYHNIKDKIWAEAGEELIPMADELDLQEREAERQKLAKFAALKRLLAGE